VISLSTAGLQSWTIKRKLTSIYHLCIVTLLCMFVTCDSIGGMLTRTNKLGFQPEFLGCVQLVVAFTNLAGVALYNTYLKHVSRKKMFFWTSILGMVLGLTQVSSLSEHNSDGVTYFLRVLYFRDLFVNG
jgi:purine-cytosine permease-like protein